MATRASQPIEANSQRNLEEGGRCSFSPLDVCSDRLVLNDRPLCETFTQILRLRLVEGLDKKKPREIRNSDLSTPFYAARAGLSDVEQVLTCSMLKAFGPDYVTKHLKTTSSNLWGYYQRLAGLNCDRIGKPTFCQDIELAIAVNYEQCWYPRGYSRGELLNSISLAPGEVLQLEFFTYDRHKIERERENEGFAESTESGSVTSRSTTDVVNTTQFKIAVGAEAKANASLSLKDMDIPVDVGGEISGNFQSELSNTLTISQSTLNEATLTASNTVRNTRKTRIVETSETGTESRSTRKITNENRCHTINYDYFEILENYWVEVRPRSAEFVVKVPLPDLGPITADWLLCHEYPLRINLLDGLYGAGFDAAKLLQSAEIFKNLVTDPPPVVLPEDAPAGNGGGPAPDPVGDQLRIFLRAIVDASQRLQSATVTPSDWVDIFLFGTPEARAAFRDFSKVGTRDFILSVYTGIFDRIDELNTRRNDRGEDLIQHFDIFLNQMQAVGVMNIVARPIKWEALQMLFLSFDDEGLIGAIQTAKNRVAALQPAINAANAAAVALPPGPNDDAAAAAPVVTVRDRVDEQFGLKTLAEARVELDRLICHIEENLDYYLNVIFVNKGLAGLQEIIESCPQIAHMVETRFINISGGFAILALNRLYQERFDQERLNRIIQDLDPGDDAGICITLPTKGTVLESRLGECSACEPFIEKHRVLDLEAKQQELLLNTEKIRQEKAEADRYEQRLAEDPKVLGDPVPPASAIGVSVVHNEPDGD